MRRMIPQSYQDWIKAIKESIKSNGESLSEARIYEKITDSEGHLRFVEGEITISKTISDLGITQTYGKWSLSGTHLMLVISIVNTSGDTITIPQWSQIFNVNLPEWIKNKLVGVGTSNVLFPKIFNAIPVSTPVYTTSDFYTYIEKNPDGVQAIVSANYSFLDDRLLRLEFDLLIDND